MKITIKQKKEIEVYPENILKGKVVRSGNGAVIKCLKKYIGQEALVLINPLVNPRKLTKKEEKELSEKWYDYLY